MVSSSKKSTPKSNISKIYAFSEDAEPNSSSDGSLSPKHRLTLKAVKNSKFVKNQKTKRPLKRQNVNANVANAFAYKNSGKKVGPKVGPAECRDNCQDSSRSSTSKRVPHPPTSLVTPSKDYCLKTHSESTFESPMCMTQEQEREQEQLETREKVHMENARDFSQRKHNCQLLFVGVFLGILFVHLVIVMEQYVGGESRVGNMLFGICLVTVRISLF